MIRQHTPVCQPCRGSGCPDCGFTGAAGATPDGHLATRLPVHVQPCPDCNGKTTIETMKGPQPCPNGRCDDGAVAVSGARYDGHLLHRDTRRARRILLPRARLERPLPPGLLLGVTWMPCPSEWSDQAILDAGGLCPYCHHWMHPDRPVTRHKRFHPHTGVREWCPGAGKPPVPDPGELV